MSGLGRQVCAACQEGASSPPLHIAAPLHVLWQPSFKHHAESHHLCLVEKPQGVLQEACGAGDRAQSVAEYLGSAEGFQLCASAVLQWSRVRLAPPGWTSLRRHREVTVCSKMLVFLTVVKCVPPDVLSLDY